MQFVRPTWEGFSSPFCSALEKDETKMVGCFPIRPNILKDGPLGIKIAWQVLLELLGLWPLTLWRSGNKLGRPLNFAWTVVASTLGGWQYQGSCGLQEVDVWQARGATAPGKSQATTAPRFQVVDEFLHRMTVTISNYAIYQVKLSTGFEVVVVVADQKFFSRILAFWVSSADPIFLPS